MFGIDAEGSGGIQTEPSPSPPISMIQGTSISQLKDEIDDFYSLIQLDLLKGMLILAIKKKKERLDIDQFLNDPSSDEIYSSEMK